MKRTYNSRRRMESALQTRQSIIEAAVKLHGQGITTLSAVAEEAGVSLPTLNKYFPTREDLFTACTTHVAQQLQFAAPETIRAIANPQARLHRVVEEVFRLHEETFGQLWTGYKLEDESPVLARAVAAQEELVSTLADTLTEDSDAGDRDTIRQFVRAALNPLTYRALRSRNGLSFEDAVCTMTRALAGLLKIEA